VLANALNAIETPLRAMSVTLVPGGSIARVVAMVVTEPPMPIDMHMQTDLSRHFLLALHTELLHVVRRAGLRRLAMPTLCTGGIGMPPDLVAEAIVRSWINDLHNHPQDPLFVRIACYEAEHILCMMVSKDEGRSQLYCVRDEGTSLHAAEAAAEPC
jgi:O-acetyl-ADP-ribose deacetylase (regulator of RNase III)